MSCNTRAARSSPGTSTLDAGQPVAGFLEHGFWQRGGLGPLEITDYNLTIKLFDATTNQWVIHADMSAQAHPFVEEAIWNRGLQLEDGTLSGKVTLNHFSLDILLTSVMTFDVLV